MQRRAFVRHSALSLLALGLSPELLLAKQSRKKVICIFQRGGADGLSMVVPYADADYYLRRPSIALPAESLIDIDGFFGLHPALEPIHHLFISKKMSVVHAVGTSDRIDSHLDAQRLVADAAIDCGHDVEFIDICGWDTHAAQGNQQGELANRLSTLAQTLKTLTDELGDRLDDVAIVTMSEFGRSVAENEAGGTDHGHATCMFVCGGAFDGGKVYSDWPGLRDRDLRATTDLRDVLARLR